MKIPEWWISGEKEIQNYYESNIVIGEKKVIAITPGGRKVISVSYGEPEPELKGTANFNSAVAAEKPEVFFNRALRKRPVFMILAGVHGGEVEGMMGALSILNIMETGLNIKGEPMHGLREKLRKLRLVVIPLANPDGRARIPYKGWVGTKGDDYTGLGEGTRKDGSVFLWPECMEIHPMKGNVGFLGGYFDDNGINIYHDEWFCPMSTTTSAILEIARMEAPDIVLDLHSNSGGSGIDIPPYLSLSAKKSIHDLIHEYGRRLAENGFASTRPGGEEETGVEQPFNLDSALYHSGAFMPVLFESTQGFSDQELRYDYDELLEIHNILIEVAVDFLLKRR